MAFLPFLLLVPWLAAADDIVVVSLADLERKPPETTEKPPQPWFLDGVQVSVAPEGDLARIRLVLDVRALELTWANIPILEDPAFLVEKATLDGRDVALAPDKASLAASIGGAHRVEIEGTVAAPNREVVLRLPTAARRSLAFEGKDLEARVKGGVQVARNRFDLPGESSFTVSWHPPVAPSPKPVVVTAQVASAVRVDEGGLEGHATVGYRVSNGTVSQVVFDLSVRADAVEILGPAVDRFERMGDRVTVYLNRPVEGQISLDVTWRAPLLDNVSTLAPFPVPMEVNSQEGWVSLASGDEAMVVPEPGRNLEAVTVRSLPDEAKGLVAGTPSAAWRVKGRDAALSYRILRYTPVEGPPTLVDEARYQVALTDHGRGLLKAVYTVRNDRRQFLHVVPPKGFSAMGTRVAGRVVQPVSDGQTGIYVPLEKSVESLQGLVSFPVEVYFWGEEGAWSRKGRRNLVSPSVDAPVAYARWEVILPPGFRLKGHPAGTATTVETWTEGGTALSYGRAYGQQGQTEDAERDKYIIQTSAKNSRGLRLPQVKLGKSRSMIVEEPPADTSGAEDASQEAFNQAYRAYNANKFDEADRYLKEAILYDSSNVAAQALQQNVDLLNSDDRGGKDDDSVQARRVRDLARARATDTVLAQEASEQEAEEALKKGDLAEAEKNLEKLVTTTEEMTRYEQKGSQEQTLVLDEAKKKLAEVRSKRKAEEKPTELAKPSTVNRSSTGRVAKVTRTASEGKESGADSWGWGDSDGVPDAWDDIPVTEGAATIVFTDGDIRTGDDEISVDDLRSALQTPESGLALDRQQATLPPLIQTWEPPESEPSEIYFEDVELAGDLLTPDAGVLIGAGGLGMRGQGLGGGGTAEGIGGLGTVGKGSGQGYGAGAPSQVAIGDGGLDAPETLSVPGEVFVGGGEVAAQTFTGHFSAAGMAAEPTPMVVVQADEIAITTPTTPPCVVAASPKPNEGPPPPKAAYETPPATTISRTTSSTAPARPSAQPMAAVPQPTVTASRFVINLPIAGESLRFEQRLVPPDVPLTVQIRYTSHLTHPPAPPSGTGSHRRRP